MKVYKKDHRLYSTWKSMKSRCNNPNVSHYKYYGGKGVKVCNEWLDFWVFVKDMYPSFKEGLTLDRLDNNGDYSLANCRWSTPVEQASNQSTSLKILYKGDYVTEHELSRLTGIPRSTLQARRIRGCSIEEIIAPLRNITRIFYKGKYYTIQELSDLVGVDSSTIRYRYKRGYKIEDIVKRTNI